MISTRSQVRRDHALSSCWAMCDPPMVGRGTGSAASHPGRRKVNLRPAGSEALEGLIGVRVAREVGLKTLSDSQTLQRLAKKLAKDEVARKLLTVMPDEVSEDDINLTLDTPYSRILQELGNANQNADYEAFVRAVPVRDTNFRSQVARALLFQSFARYEKAALVAITEAADPPPPSCLRKSSEMQFSPIRQPQPGTATPPT
jgi:hypothetical protein